MRREGPSWETPWQTSQPRPVCRGRGGGRRLLIWATGRHDPRRRRWSREAGDPATGRGGGTRSVASRPPSLQAAPALQREQREHLLCMPRPPQPHPDTRAPTGRSVLHSASCQRRPLASSPAVSRTPDAVATEMVSGKKQALPQLGFPPPSGAQERDAGRTGNSPFFFSLPLLCQGSAQAHKSTHTPSSLDFSEMLIYDPTNTPHTASSSTHFILRGGLLPIVGL